MQNAYFGFTIEACTRAFDSLNAHLKRASSNGAEVPAPGEREETSEAVQSAQPKSLRITVQPKEKAERDEEKAVSTGIGKEAEESAVEISTEDPVEEAPELAEAQEAPSDEKGTSLSEAAEGSSEAGAEAHKEAAPEEDEEEAIEISITEDPAGAAPNPSAEDEEELLFTIDAAGEEGVQEGDEKEADSSQQPEACWACAEVGHDANDCPDKGCNLRGHAPVSCPTLAALRLADFSHVRQAAGAMPSHASKPGASSGVDGLVDPGTMHALWDSGASELWSATQSYRSSRACAPLSRNGN
eukprot:Skav208454  [mRNA]  locus=scaffold1104:97033:102733:+ [translate_table: standard]